MHKLGFHASISGGIHRSVDRASQLEVDAFQIFLGSPRSWKHNDPETEYIKQFKENLKRSNIDKIVCHLSYLPNPSSSDDLIINQTKNAFTQQLDNSDKLDIDYLVIHIGSHKGRGVDEGVKRVVSMLDFAISRNNNVKMLLETSAGSKNSVGSKFNEIGKIIDNASDPSKIGVCLDTCHVFAAGYDIRDEDKVDNTLSEFNDFIGLDKLSVLHLNDSKGPLSSAKDRHEHIGLGKIGLNGFDALLNHRKLKNLPAIIETPVNEIRGNRENLDILRKLMNK